jgi:hypothetical protein
LRYINRFGNPLTVALLFKIDKRKSSVKASPRETLVVEATHGHTNTQTLTHWHTNTQTHIHKQTHTEFYTLRVILWGLDFEG